MLMYIHTAFIHKKVVKKIWKIERDNMRGQVQKKINIIVEKIYKKTVFSVYRRKNFKLL